LRKLKNQALEGLLSGREIDFGIVYSPSLSPSKPHPTASHYPNGSFQVENSQRSDRNAQRELRPLASRRRQRKVEDRVNIVIKLFVVIFSSSSLATSKQTAFARLAKKKNVTFRAEKRIGFNQIVLLG
jgi:hypothetical protein